MIAQQQQQQQGIASVLQSSMQFITEPITITIISRLR